MKRKLIFLAYSLFLVAFLLSGCGGGKETETPDIQRTESPLPTPDQVADIPSPIQTPSPGLTDWDAEPEAGKVVLRGRVEMSQSSVLLGELFLAQAVPTSNPDIDLLELDENKAPRASLNHDTGEFVFVNVEPGKYGVIAWEPMGSIPLNEPETGETFFIELVADQVVDVGTLYFP